MPATGQDKPRDPKVPDKPQQPTGKKPDLPTPPRDQGSGHTREPGYDEA
jgi:hypothetical protein